MNIADFFTTIYQTGILALAIVLLAIAILVYPTLRKYSGSRKKWTQLKMKIEQYFASYRPEQFKAHLTYRQQRESVGKSPITIIAHEPIAYGVSGIIEWEGFWESVGGSPVATKIKTGETPELSHPKCF